MSAGPYSIDGMTVVPVIEPIYIISEKKSKYVKEKTTVISAKCRPRKSAKVAGKKSAKTCCTCTKLNIGKGRVKI